MTKLFEDKKTPIINQFHTVMGAKGLKLFGSYGGKINNSQIESIKKFTDETIEKLKK